MSDVVPAANSQVEGIVDAEVIAATTGGSASAPRSSDDFDVHSDAPAAATGTPLPARRTATIERLTGETSVQVELDLDGSGDAKIATGIGFFDHMLHQIAKHGGFDLTVETIGRPARRRAPHDRGHHARARAALAEALGDKRGIRRFGDAVIPLDEVLVQAAVDLSGRPYVVHDEPPLAPYIGPIYPTSMTRHVWESLGHAARMTLHVSVLRASRPGSSPDAHHVVEAQFKAVARALRDGGTADPYGAGVPSTKGVL